jgi:hypothetical protein
VKKIWVIEEGSYSNYRVVGVFSSRKNAEVVAKALKSGYDNPTIACWALDPIIEELSKGLRQHLVLMLRDGTVERIGATELTSYEISGSASIWRRSSAPAYKGKGVPDCLQATVWAKDEKHAVKIANEIRGRMIANGEWK